MTAISQPQNFEGPVNPVPKPYGLRISLPPGDPFSRIMGAQWYREYWYATAAERDVALADMSRRHEYSRIGDKPALVFAKVENLAISRLL